MTTKQDVSPCDIEHKLVEICDQLQGTNKMRACLFNMIIFTASEKRADYLHKITQKLIEKFPSRIIFITIDGEPEQVKTTVSVIDSGEESTSIVCDLITIDLGKNKEKLAPFIAVPQILPDLPVYLLWGDDPNIENQVAATLEKYVTRIIYDSETTTHLGKFAKTVLNHAATSKADFADLNWGRIEGWRHILADIFHNPSHQVHFGEMKEIHVEYNNREKTHVVHQQVQAFYLQTWLATQLGWKIQTFGKDDDQNICISYDNNGHATSAFLTPSNRPDIAGGRILSITMITEKEEKMVFTRHKDKPHIVLFQLSTPDHCDVPTEFIFDRYESGLSATKEISRKGTSVHLRRLFEVLAEHENEPELQL
ncbi:MAG: glucose-6-phosphate dehydrogenase assembly protein OpcA [Simkaniaceae bacterium]|nr:glucose-6-phosphate dehydrogenase assembly protein OpcA [Simkaniaceae bacterium]